MDGSNIEDLIVRFGVANVSGIALDLQDRKLYYSTFNAIYRANLDGSDREELADGPDGLDEPEDLSLVFPVPPAMPPMSSTGGTDGLGQAPVQPSMPPMSSTRGPEPPPAPAISSTGLALLALAVCGAGTAIIRRQRQAA